jgi:glucokinase
LDWDTGDKNNHRHSKYRIGIDLGGTNIKIGIVDENNKIVTRRSTPTLVNRNYQEIIKSMAEAVFALLEFADISVKKCISLGIGSPGVIDSKTGTVVYSNNFGWEKVPIIEELKKYIDLPMLISNDANCAALGEVAAGAAMGCDNVVLLTLGTGIGSGIILNGKLFEGSNVGGSEFGHSVLVVDGEKCTCGRNGCFEAYASATALIRETKKAAQENKTSLINLFSENDLSKICGVTPFKAMEYGDPVAKEVIVNYVKYLSDGIINLINLFRPDKVLISGGICNQGDNLLKPVNEYVSKYCFGGSHTFIPTVMKASLGNMAGIIGAASLHNYL